MKINNRRKSLYIVLSLLLFVWPCMVLPGPGCGGNHAASSKSPEPATTAGTAEAAVAGETAAATQETGPAAVATEASGPAATSTEASSAASSGAAAPAPAAAATPAAPAGACSKMHAGMICIQAGPAAPEVGAGVELSDFQIDAKVGTVGEYDQCVIKGKCPALGIAGITGTRKPEEDAKPAVAPSWLSAMYFCAWQGKRLPTVWEWRKAMSVPGGIAESVGDHAEWTSTWSYLSEEKCGANCKGKDPLGPCETGFPCMSTTKKIALGGNTPELKRNGAAFPVYGGKGPQVRCATSKPYLTKNPPKIVTNPPPEPPDPTPPTAEELAAFNGIVEDEVEKVKLCPERKRSFIDCRDPNHYVKGNEPFHRLFGPYIKNRGGGLIGLASDANYALVANARSQWVWLVDYDPVVVYMHRVMGALVPKSETPEKLIELFTYAKQADGAKIISEAWAGEPELKAYIEEYKVYGPMMAEYLRGQLKNGGDYGWLSNVKHFNYVKLMFAQGRMKSFKGNLLADSTLKTVAEAARKLNTPIRIYYPSNAPEYWQMPKQYRANIRNLPMDDLSVIVQTFSGLQTGFGQLKHWHYNVQQGLQHQERMGRPDFVTVRYLLDDRLYVGETELTICGLPSEE